MVETKQDQSMPKVIVTIASDTRLDKHLLNALLHCKNILVL